MQNVCRAWAIEAHGKFKAKSVFMLASFINRSKVEEVFIRKHEERIQFGAPTLCVRKLASKTIFTWELVAWFPAIRREIIAMLALRKVSL